MKVAQKNDLHTYLIEWENKIKMMNRLSKKYKNDLQSIHKPVEALNIQNTDLRILLRYLDSKLKILENNQIPFLNKFQDYADALVFLKCTYMVYRILIDTISRIIRSFYEKNEGIKLPRNPFIQMGKSKNKGKIPEELKIILSKANKLFSEIIDRRDALVHDCESFLILIKGSKDGMNILEYSNRPYGEKIKNFGEIRGSIGILLCVHQQLIDDLLNHLDLKLKTWYGIVGSNESRTWTMTEWDCSNLLWWAVKYGNYKHTDLRIDRQ